MRYLRGQGRRKAGGAAVLFAVLAAVSICAGAGQLPHARRVLIGIGGGLELVSDFYAPPQATAPGLLLLHGWDWPDRSPASGLRVFARDFQRAGYAVLVPNMRGWPPTGGRDDCGGQQVEDSLRALQWLGARRSVDPKRLFVAGYSQGGQVALLAAGAGAPVRAVTAFAPVTDLQSWAERTDTPGIRGYLHAECGGPAGWPARSALEKVTRHFPPVLLVHGDNDRRVPTSQSLSLYQKLRGNRASAELRLIPGVGHEVDAVILPQLAIDFFASVVKTKAALAGRNGRLP
ncbi:MAG: alpha/beta fold hydrolase [Sedimenticolaceae bacterium]